MDAERQQKTSYWEFYEKVTSELRATGNQPWPVPP